MQRVALLSRTIRPTRYPRTRNLKLARHAHDAARMREMRACARTYTRAHTHTNTYTQTQVYAAWRIYVCVAAGRGRSCSGVGRGLLAVPCQILLRLRWCAHHDCARRFWTARCTSRAITCARLYIQSRLRQHLRQPSRRRVSESAYLAETCPKAVG